MGVQCVAVLLCTGGVGWGGVGVCLRVVAMLISMSLCVSSARPCATDVWGCGVRLVESIFAAMQIRLIVLFRFAEMCDHWQIWIDRLGYH